MELLKKNIHMDRTGAEAVSQITLEEDVNIPDQKPDAEKIVFRKGTVVIDEVKPGTEQVSVRGRLLYTMLYETKEEGACGGSKHQPDSFQKIDSSGSGDVTGLYGGDL